MSSSNDATRKPLIVANWKMNKNGSETEAFIKDFAKNIPKSFDRDVVLCPPFPSLERASQLLKGSAVGLGAQNLSENKPGAYTGEVDGKMLKDAGCHYVIIGHSERRHYQGENDRLVNKKIIAAFESDLVPIVCVGEKLNQREENKTLEVVSTQVKGALEDLPSGHVKRLVFAYEPVWAIGTGKTATPAQAQEVHLAIRDILKDLYGSLTSLGIRILYGGSVKPENMSELMACEDIDGGLVGGASLKPDSFLKIATYKTQTAAGK